MLDEQRLQKMSDRIEIEDLLTRYCRAIDAKDMDLLDEVFVPEAQVDYTSAGGIRGDLAEVKVWLAQALALFPVTQHLVTNVDLVIEGDRCRSRCSLYII